jgi:hypothetical protein
MQREKREPLSDSTKIIEHSIIESLESDQLASAKAHHYSRRHLLGAERIVLSLLRLYVLFMMGVVAYQVWTGTR